MRDNVKSVGGIPWEPIPGREGIEIKSTVNERRDPDEEVQRTLRGEVTDIQTRRFRIERSDIVKYGTTNGCPGCRAANQGGRSVNHNETCRTRFSQKMAEQRDPRIQRDQEKFGGMEEDDTASIVPEIEQDEKDSVIEEEEEVPAEDEDMGMEYMVQNATKQKWVKTKKYWGQISDVANQETMYWDDMSGELLISSEVQRARMEEMEEVKKHQVYKRFPSRNVGMKQERDP